MDQLTMGWRGTRNKPHTPSPSLVKKKEEEMAKLQNPTDNTGYMP